MENSKVEFKKPKPGDAVYVRMDRLDSICKESVGWVNKESFVIFGFKDRSDDIAVQMNNNYRQTWAYAPKDLIKKGEKLVECTLDGDGQYAIRKE